MPASVGSSEDRIAAAMATVNSSLDEMTADIVNEMDINIAEEVANEARDQTMANANAAMMASFNNSVQSEMRSFAFFK